MSHKDLAGNTSRGAKRRKVEFHTTLEDLEGRLLLSTVRQFRPREAQALVRQQLQNGALGAARQRPQALPRATPQALAAARAQQQQAFAERQQAMAERRASQQQQRLARPGIRVEVNPVINVNPTINVGGATANPVVNYTPPQSQATPTPTPNAQTSPPASPNPTPTNPAPATPNQPAPTPTNPAPTNPTPSTPTPNTPAKPTLPVAPRPTTPVTPTPTPNTPAKPTPNRPGHGSWTDITNPGGATPKPSTPTPNPKPTTPAPTTPTTPPPTTPAEPAPTTPAPTTPAEPAPTTPAPTTPAEPAPTTPAPTTPAEPAPTSPAKPAPTFPDGTILRNEQTGELGYYSGGKRGLISPPVAEKMGLKAEQTKAVTDEDFQAVAKGSDYFPEGIFLRNDQDGEIARYSNGKLHVVSPPILALLGIGVGDVATIGSAQYSGVTKGPDYIPEGTLIQNQQTAEIGIYRGGQRSWISVPVAARMNLQPSQLVVISPTQFNAIPQGKDYFPNGVYLQNQETGEIARYDSGKRSLVSSPIAARLGLTATDLISVSGAQYAAVTKGVDYIPEGLFLKNNQTGELAHYAEGRRHWVSPPVATAINLTDAMIVTIGADQFNAIPRGGDYTPPAPDPLA